MNNQESLEFIRTYFDELFGKRNINVLDLYLDTGYFDDDIGDPQTDHIQDSKEFLANLFAENQTITVEVNDAIARDDVISAYLEWITKENGSKQTIRKGVAIFVVKDQKILRRHTFIYFEN
jgi:hypothetical protein